MRLEPDGDAFTERYARGEAQLLSTRLVSDLETPVSAYLKLANGALGPSFLLESVEGGEQRGRYSIIGLAPDLLWKCEQTVASVSHDGLTYQPEPDGPLDSLRRLLAAAAIPDLQGLPPMSAGVFGYLGYDMVRLMERLPPAKPDPIGVPDGLLMRPTLIAVFDVLRSELVLVTPVRPRPSETARMAFERGRETLERAVAAIEGALPAQQQVAGDAPLPGPRRSNTAPGDYERMVAHAKEHILAGDIFQVVLSQRFEAEFTLPPFSLYRALRRVNPSPFLSFLDFGDVQIVCSSPEILVRQRDGVVTLRPIAGTRPRGVTPAADLALEEELLADPKERAEHLMLLDLGRNDVGRIAEIGSVQVEGSFFIERYSHVMHIVSEVTGRLRPGLDAVDALRGGFPAGTVSGAPKIRAMEIIDALEPEKRGIYAGCIGYFGADGSMDTCIVLRTAVVKNGRMHVQAGAGIVHDSVAAAEQAECEAKAGALFRAADEATRFAAGLPGASQGHSARWTPGARS